MPLRKKEKIVIKYAKVARLGIRTEANLINKFIKVLNGKPFGRQVFGCYLRIYIRHFRFVSLHIKCVLKLI